MRAWLMDDYTGIEGLRTGEVPDPEPAPGEVVLKVDFAGLNPADRYLAEKQYPVRPQLPHILGRDATGVVVKTGPGVAGVKVGDRRSVLRGDAGGIRPGTFAEYVAVPADGLVECPSHWSHEQCAGASLVYLTAWQALTMWGPLPERAIVLVTGASGGVGVASVQLASALGHTVVALSRSTQKSTRLKELGATETFDPSTPKWRQEAKERLEPRRVDLAIDSVGGKLLPEVIDMLGDHGKVSLVGRLAGPVPNFNTATLFFRRIRLGGVAVGTYQTTEAHAAWKTVLSLLEKSHQSPLVDSVFPFEQLPQAFARLAEGPMGKVLIKTGS